MTAGLLAPDTPLAFPVAIQWPLRRGSARYRRGGGACIKPASRFTQGWAPSVVCVSGLVPPIKFAGADLPHARDAVSVIERGHGHGRPQTRLSARDTSRF